MNNKDFISYLSQRSGYSVENTNKLVHSVIDAMCDSFEEGEPVQIPNFGTFEVKKRLERIMVNPANGQRMLVPPKLVLSFRPIASLKEKLKNGGVEDD